MASVQLTPLPLSAATSTRVSGEGRLAHPEPHRGRAGLAEAPVGHARVDRRVVAGLRSEVEERRLLALLRRRRCPAGRRGSLSELELDLAGTDPPRRGAHDLSGGVRERPLEQFDAPSAPDLSRAQAERL